MKNTARNKRIAKMVLKGKYTYGQVGERFGLAEATVRYTVQTLGIDVPKRDRTKRLPDIAQIKREYLAGFAPSVLARKYGHADETVRRELLAVGLPMRERGEYFRRFTDAEEIRMGELYLSGATLAEISFEYGHGDKALTHSILQRCGIPLRTTKESRDLRGTWKTGPRQSVVEYP